jgi:CRP-like cAMP-binding protein
MGHTTSREFEVLATSGWLADTPADFRYSLLDRCLLKRYAAGDSVYRAGDPAGGLYGLISGGIGVELSPDHREPYIATFARPGFWIGEASVLTRASRLVGIRAIRDSQLAHLPLPQWDALVQTAPEAWRWLAHLILRNERLALAIAEALMIRDSGQRVAAILAILSAPSAVPSGSPAAEIEISQDDLARMANLSRSSTGRILRTLEDAGLIETHYRQIRVLDHEGLTARRGIRS